MLVQSGSLVYRHDAFRCLWTVAQGAMGYDCVVAVRHLSIRTWASRSV